ncbi:hypothetical protein DN600_02775, partial [Aeromonas caviae]
MATLMAGWAGFTSQAEWRREGAARQNTLVCDGMRCGIKGGDRGRRPLCCTPGRIGRQGAGSLTGKHTWPDGAAGAGEETAGAKNQNAPAGLGAFRIQGAALSAG